MRWRTARSTVLACLALALGACEELNVPEDEQPDEGEGGDSGGSSGGGSHGDHGDGDDGDDGDGHDGDGHDGDDTDTSKPPRVELESCGGVEGAWADHGVRKFLGIPYAKEPSGDLRWAAPRAPDKWEDDLKATKLARACPQIGDKIAKDADHPEDCLYLNVWSKGGNAKTARPVMVWFHGGEHQQGSAAERGDDDTRARFDGTALAADSGVVVVTINYRLGPLGFLPLGKAPTSSSKKQDADASEAPALFGNQGLWDQTFALRWVQDNIEAFGGDPDNVTIFGQGSGASDVCMHVASPESGGEQLFQQAISQSGGCTTYQRTSKQVLADASDWLSKLECNKPTATEITACLRKKSVHELFDAIPNLAAARKWFTPSVDGTFLPDQPRELFDSGIIADVPYILGSNANDGSELLSGLTVDSEDAYHKELAKLFPSATEEQRCEAYPHDQYASAKKPYQVALSHVLADGTSSCAVLDTAQRARVAGSEVYAYLFTGPDGDDAGAGYGAEIEYVFGNTELSGHAAELRNLIQNHWTSFATDGEPDGGEDALEWPLFGTKRKLLKLGKEVEVLSDARKAQCALWWDAYDAEFDAPTPKEDAADAAKDEVPSDKS